MDPGHFPIVSPDCKTTEFPETRHSLLKRLPDAEDIEAWEEFARAYVPVICGFAMERGCGFEELEEFTQLAMTGVVEKISQSKPPRGTGRFRDWLVGEILDPLAGRYPIQKPARARGGGGSVQTSIGTQWQEASIRQAFRLAVKEMGEELGMGREWQAFRRTILNGEDPVRVARDLGASLGAVHLWRSRILSQLKRRMVAIEVKWETQAHSFTRRWAAEDC